VTAAGQPPRVITESAGQHDRRLRSRFNGTYLTLRDGRVAEFTTSRHLRVETGSKLPENRLRR